MGSESVTDYISVTDDETPFMQVYENVPKTHRIKDMTGISFISSGSPCGMAAHMVIDFEVKKHGYDLDIDASDATCNQLAFRDLLDQLHESVNIKLFRVKKNMQALCSCIANGRPVAITLPVTEDVFDKHFSLPDGEMFGLVPVVLWAYSKAANTFIGYVPLNTYETHIKIDASHVLSTDSCDAYSVIMEQSDDVDEPLFLQ